MTPQVVKMDSLLWYYLFVFVQMKGIDFIWQKWNKCFDD